MTAIKILVHFLLIAAVCSEDIAKDTEPKKDDGTMRPTTEENALVQTGSEVSTTSSTDKVSETSTTTKHQDALVEAENSLSESSSDTTTLPYSTESHKKSHDASTVPTALKNNKGKVRTVTIRKEIRYAVPHPVPFPVRIPVEVPVDRPYPVHVVQPYPIAVEKQFPYPVAFSGPVAVSVPQPYLIKQIVPILISDQSNFHDRHYIRDYEDQRTIQTEDKLHRGRNENFNHNRYNPSNQESSINTVSVYGNKNGEFHNSVHQGNAVGVPNKSVVNHIGVPLSSGFQTPTLQNNNVYVPSLNTNVARDNVGNLKTTQASTSSFHNQQNGVSSPVSDDQSGFLFQNGSPHEQNGAGRSEPIFNSNSPQSGITSNYLRVTSTSSGNSHQNTFSDGSSPEQQNFGHIGQTTYSNEAASINRGINSFSNHASTQVFSDSLAARTQSTHGGSDLLDESYVRPNIQQSKFQASYETQNQNPLIISQGNQLASSNTYNSVIPSSNTFGAQRTISANQRLATELTRHRSANN